MNQLVPAPRPKIGGKIRSPTPKWEENIVSGGLKEQLPEYIRRIRNSLMHGAKFYGQIETDSRNWKLISSSLIIIEHWINLSEKVKNRFRLS